MLLWARKKVLCGSPEAISLFCDPVLCKYAEQQGNLRHCTHMDMRSSKSPCCYFRMSRIVKCNQCDRQDDNRYYPWTIVIPSANIDHTIRRNHSKGSKSSKGSLGSEGSKGSKRHLTGCKGSVGFIGCKVFKKSKGAKGSYGAMGAYSATHVNQGSVTNSPTVCSQPPHWQKRCCTTIHSSLESHRRVCAHPPLII